MLLGMDPPDHGRLRATISRALTPRRVAMLGAPIRERCRRADRGHRARGALNSIGDFAALLPMWVISRLLGVPDGDQDELRRLADVMVHREDGTRGVPAGGQGGGRATSTPTSSGCSPSAAPTTATTS